MTDRQVTPTEAHLDLIFDGRCGFCTRAVGWVHRLDRHRRISTHAYQEPDVLERFGLTESQAHTAVWAVVGGTPSAGAAAVAETLDTALGPHFWQALPHPTSTNGPGSRVPMGRGSPRKVPRCHAVVRMSPGKLRAQNYVITRISAARERQLPGRWHP